MMAADLDLRGRHWWVITREGQRLLVRSVPSEEMERAATVILNGFVDLPLQRWVTEDSAARRAYADDLLCGTLVRQPGLKFGQVLELDGYRCVAAFNDSEDKLTFPEPVNDRASSIEQVFDDYAEKIMTGRYVHLNLMASAETRGGLGTLLMNVLFGLFDDLGLSIFGEDISGWIPASYGFKVLGSHTFAPGVTVEFIRRDPRVPAWRSLTLPPLPDPFPFPDLRQRLWTVPRKDTTSHVTAVEERNAKRAVDVILPVFFYDAISQWISPDVQDRLDFQSVLFGDCFVRQPSRFGYVHEVDGFRAVACWSANSMDFVYPERDPSKPPNPRTRVAMQELQAAEERILGDAPLSFHLIVLAVDPLYESMGYARAVCQPMLELADQLGVPCYLENSTQTERGLRFYESMGFETKHIIKFSDENPRVHVPCMRRDPQKSSQPRL